MSDDQYDDTIDFERVVHSMEELLDACRCDSLLMLEQLIEDHVDGYMHVWGEGNPGGSGDGDIEVCEPHLGRGTCFAFPFPVGELFESAEDFRAMFLIEDELLELAATIETIEGFEVELELDPDATGVPARLRRRETAHGVLVQEIRWYPFKKRMSSDATFGEWLRERLFRDNPGLMVVDGFDDDVRLAAIRGEEPMPPRRRRHPRG
jgi:hypothetical protein